MADQSSIHLLSQYISPFNFLPHDYNRVIDDIGDAHIVLMGEATHGTHEFFKIRTELTQQLIEKKGFNALAIEADWPDASLINKYVKKRDPSLDAYKALEKFSRFPTWLWRNHEMIRFMDWLSEYNDQWKKDENKTGVFGLDLYSLHESMKQVIECLKKLDPKAAVIADRRYQCLQHHIDDPVLYGYEISQGLIPGCKQEVFSQLIDVLKLEIQKLHDPQICKEELLFLTQNAKIVTNAEAYYRSLFKGPEVTQNLRAKHMMDTLENLRIYHQRILGGCFPKIIIWAHNWHVGDARATRLFRADEINLGQLARDTYGRKCYLLGFSTFQGELTAATSWEGVAEQKNLRPAIEGSYEHLFHQINLKDFILFLNEDIPLIQPALQRYVGVIYKPEIEDMCNYHYTYLPQQFDSIIHIDETHALLPLLSPEEVKKEELKTKKIKKENLPKTFPSGY